MRQRVRQSLATLSPSQAAIATVVVAVLFILVTVIMTAPDSDPSTSPGGAAETEEAVLPSGDRRAGNVGAVIAGFGLIGLWAAAGAFVLVRARRQRDASAESSAQADDG